MQDIKRAQRENLSNVPTPPPVPDAESSLGHVPLEGVLPAPHGNFLLSSTSSSTLIQLYDEPKGFYPITRSETARDCVCSTHVPVDIQPNVPAAVAKIIIVRIDAPALSPVVGGAVEPLKLSEEAPALLLPTLVPPVELVTGATTRSTSKDETAPKTFICWPAPTLPSKVPLHHPNPHCLPVVPPVHCLIAAAVEVFKTDVIWS